jgi:hypothetical protein
MYVLHPFYKWRAIRVPLKVFSVCLVRLGTAEYIYTYIYIYNIMYIHIYRKRVERDSTN